MPCQHVRQLIDRRATEIDRRIAELQAIRAELARLARRARRLDPTRCAPTAVCHIIGPLEPSGSSREWPGAPLRARRGVERV